MKVSYSCVENIFNIVSSHNKKLLNNNAPNAKPCNCRTKSISPLNSPCATQDINYKCTVLALVNLD